MGLFDKKYCDICGEKIGMLGNRKLEDGNLCKTCAKKLSPFFDDRRHSTVEQIKDQLAYREQNKAVLRAFNPTRIIGKNSQLIYIDEAKRQFVIARKIDDGENHDVINLSQVTNCYMDVKEHRTEEMRTDNDGNRVSYNPPVYKFSYDYYVYVMVNSPYFDEIKLKINNFQVGQNDIMTRNNVENICREMVNYLSQMSGAGANMNAYGMNMQGQMYQQPMNQGYANQGQMYQQPMNQGYANQGQMYQQPMNQGYANQGQMYQQPVNQGYANQGYANQGQMYQQPMNQGYANQGQMYQQPMNQQGGTWFCSNCGAANDGRFCENCGTPRQ